MQTFLPYADFDRSAQCLDDKRLGNQAYNECLVLLRGGWANHPASKMWRGYRYHLARYMRACLLELKRRGRNYPYWLAVAKHYQSEFVTTELILPPWLGDEKFHAAHRSNLLRKNPEHYGQFGWTEPHDLPYVWPEGVCNATTN